jgi:hypothetical protein
MFLNGFAATFVHVYKINTVHVKLQFCVSMYIFLSVTYNYLLPVS